MKCLKVGVLILASLQGVIHGASSPPWPETVAENAVLEEVYHDDRFFEGPTWDPGRGKLFFTAFSQTNQQILRLEQPGKVSVWLENTEGINGTFLSNDGRLLACQAYGHRLMSYGIGMDGPLDVKTLLFDPTLHQPNDLCQVPRGDIYFTDPDFNGKKTSAVYRLSPAGELTKIIAEISVPNGIIASPKGRMLYVADSHRKCWMAYPIFRDGAVGPGSIFFQPEAKGVADPDGMTIDERGNLYLTGLGGIWVVNPKGNLLGFIPVPEFCSNLTFGGRDGKTLFITCSKKVYSLQMDVEGVLFGNRVWQLFRSAD